MFAKYKFPHEDALYIINTIFLVFELFLGGLVIIKFSTTQSAAFYRRTVPLIDKDFRKKYESDTKEATRRQKQVGVKKHNKLDEQQIFKESEEHINLRK